MRGRAARAGAALLLGAALGGCAAGGQPADGPRAPTDELRIGLTEWSIETGPVELEPGDARLVVTNTGAADHDLVVEGERGAWRTPLLAPGERYELHVVAAPGELLHLQCTVTGHHTQGMHAHVPVQLL